MFSHRRLAGARLDAPNTEEGNGIARSFTAHSDPNTAIVFKHYQNGFPQIEVLDKDYENISYAMLQDEVPRAGWASAGEEAHNTFVKHIDANTTHVWTTLTSGVISIA